MKRYSKGRTGKDVYVQAIGREKHLLFALLASDLRMLSPERIGEALVSCASVPDGSLGQMILDKGFLEESQYRLLDQLVEELLRIHHGNAAAAITSLGGLQRIAAFIPVASRLMDDMETVGMSAVSSRDVPAASFSTVQEAPGRYTHVSDYAQGGMGRILLVRDEHLGRSVALKELMPAGAHENGPADGNEIRRSALMAARFLQEARVTGQLEHPSIVPVHELGRRTDGTLYYTMKLVKGKTLDEALRERVTLRERLELLPNFVDLCQAIAYAHDRGVIHRDIKPANIMIGDFGETVVLDWGLAKTRDAKNAYSEPVDDEGGLIEPELGAVPQTLYGRAVGTPQYMSPEQAQGLLDKIDERSDVYSLGAVLYQILTGVPPYAGDSSQEIEAKVIGSRPMPIAELVSDTPPELAGICEKALCKSPDERYQSATELAEDVQRFITGSLVHAYDYSLAEITARYYRKHRAAINTALACAGLLSIVLVYAYVNILHARDREYGLRIATEEARGNEALSRTHAEHTTYLTQLALMQEYIQAQDFGMANRIAQNVDATQRNWEWGFLLNKANPELLSVQTSSPMVASVTISPDGASVASVASQGLIQLWDLATGALKVTCEDETTPFGAPCEFSPDGTTLVAAGRDGVVRVWEANSGKLLHSLRGHTREVLSAKFSPDGAEIISASADGTARFWDIHSEKASATLDAQGPLTKAMFSPEGNALAVVSESNQVKVWSRAGLAERFQAAGEGAVFSADGARIALNLDDTAFLYDTQSGDCLRQLKGTGKISRVRFNVGSDKVLAASRDGNARLWDANTGELLCVYAHGSPLLDAVFVHNDSAIVTCSFTNDFAAWDAETGNVLNRMFGRGFVLNNVSFSRDGNRMVNACNEGCFQVWDPLHQRGRRLLDYGDPSFTNVSISEQAGLAATYKCESGVRLFPLDGGERNVLFEGNAVFYEGNHYVDFAPDGTRIAMVLDCFVPLIWDLERQDFVQLASHEGAVNAIAFAPSGQQVITASRDATARVWDVHSSRILTVLEGHTAAVNTAAFSPDGLRVVTASDDGTAGIWNAQSAQRIMVLKGHDRAVTCGVFSVDGRQVFTGSADSTVRVWDATDGHELNVIRGHAGIVNEISCGLQGSFLVTCSWDGTSRLWSAAGLEPMVVFPNVSFARFLSRASALIAATNDGRIERWDAAPWQSIKTTNVAESLARNGLDDYASARDRLIPSVEPERIVIISSERTVARCLRRLLGVLKKELAGEVQEMVAEGLTLGADLRFRSLGALGLHQDDVLLRLNGVGMGDRTLALSCLEQIVASQEQGVHGPLDMLLLRDGRGIPASIMTRACQESSQTTTLAPNAALDCVDVLIDNAINEFNVHKEPDVSLAARKRRRRTPVREGLQIQTTEAMPSTRSGLSSAHLETFDLIVGLDDEEMSNGEEVLSRLKRLRENVETGTVKGFTIDVQRGEFLLIHSQYVIQ